MKQIELAERMHNEKGGRSRTYQAQAPFKQPLNGKEPRSDLKVRLMKKDLLRDLGFRFSQGQGN